ncbi:Clavaminate synthase-like protein [Hypoxylon rubiginosum]|uniref:Clavaminate synthase-like protein n=1 Tax=Hypoxylon rubiginosum TaxID=110542 RepID=A0ACB9YIF7_9PEZI|nr:Clavaminate synthase-like protein [Hypoxylon rubiginosum]
MPPAAYIPRSLLNAETLHAYSGTGALSRGLGHTSATVPRGISIPLIFQRGIKFHLHRRQGVPDGDLVPNPRLRSRPNQIASVSKRRLASRAEEGTNIYDDFTTGTSSPSIQLVNDTTIHLGYPDQEATVVLDRHWLRDACECDICVDPDSGQKNFGTCDVPTELPIEEISSTDNGGLEVVWGKDFLTSGNHVSRYSASTIQTRLQRSLQPDAICLPTLTLWDKPIFERDHLMVDYNDWMSGEQGFLSGLHRLHTHGLLFLRNVPKSEQSVISIANQMGNLQETFYGRTWDVRHKPNAENVAYTSSFLGLHQDLLYLRDTPRIQLLHCLENTCEGGESMFSDGARAGHLIKFGSPNLFDYLLNKRVRYHYRKHGHHYEMKHPVLSENPGLIFWSPPFQASIQQFGKTEGDSRSYRKWLAAATAFRRLLEEEQWMYEYKMRPGECVIFDNLRVLHGRKKFNTASGSRWLKGAYVADDVFRSKLAVLRPQLMALGEGDEAPLEYQAKRLQDKYGLRDGSEP